MDQVKEDQTEKASRSELLVHPVGTPCRNFGVQLFSCWQAATSLFNAASSDNTAEQQAAEDALREAMLSTPSRVCCAPLCSYRACAGLARYIFQIGAPDRTVQDNMPLPCLPDFTRCPKAWEKDGSIFAHFQRVLTAAVVLAGVLCVATESYTGFLSAFSKLGWRGIAPMLPLRPLRG